MTVITHNYFHKNIIAQKEKDQLYHCEVRIVTASVAWQN